MKVKSKRIFFTREYNKFGVLDANRNIIKRHVNELAESFTKTGGNLKPVLVNKKFQVLDGQHTVEASIVAGTEIKYEIYDGNLSDEDIMVELNIHSVNWNTETFLNHYSKMNVAGYQDTIDTLSSKKINLSGILPLLRLKAKDIKAGVPILIPTDFDTKIDNLLEISEQLRINANSKNRAHIIASAMVKIEDNLLLRKSRGDTQSMESWDYNVVIKNIGKNVGENGVSDNTDAVYKVLSNSFDYNKSAVNRLSL